ncbi:hypothetical protein OG883_32900 [Streptomyces sp. NBC_01142]|uniref:glycosyltransferase family 2 protein n=1 Tax=Streptomyces sp. NBC_01142 TaxID=2975865 RepID=UPI00225683D1|nr:hypothetical protein [Streptomyces sp. NBC_01142]MCX4824574.1 hypothetical protein [Streptomyces sp. NBC_01142]
MTTTAALPDHRALLSDATGAAALRGTGPQRVLVVVPTKGRPERVRRQVAALPAGYDVAVLATAAEDLPSDLPERSGLMRRTGPYPNVGRSFGTPHPDLSAKRNIGLAMGRSGGYQAVVFIDDDVEVTAADLEAMVAALGRYTVVARPSVGVADHSMLYKVMGHAGLVTPFISGSCLATRTTYDGVFPDIYNEDWFFMWPALCRHEIGRLGDVRQVEVGTGPGGTGRRAAAEETGDVLAEGFLRSLHELPAVSWAEEAERTVRTEQYWSRALHRRHFLYELAYTVLDRFPGPDREAMTDSLRAGHNSLSELDARELADIAAELCAGPAHTFGDGDVAQMAASVMSERVRS